LKEKEYFGSYNDLINDYNDFLGFDLTADLEVSDGCVRAGLSF
jgi:hypothetical protein